MIVVTGEVHEPERVLHPVPALDIVGVVLDQPSRSVLRVVAEEPVAHVAADVLAETGTVHLGTQAWKEQTVT